jgi:ATP-binding cassette, subfamily C (CFTR/MRP), member 1
MSDLMITQLYGFSMAAQIYQDLSSTQRILYYCHHIPQEENQSILINQLENHNEKGIIEFNNVKMRYRPDLPIILDSISFKTQRMEKIGICGRKFFSCYLETRFIDHHM